MSMLEIHDLHISYGLINAVRGISLKVDAGNIVALLGANGAGKSTTLNALVGLVPIASGRAQFQGQDLTSLRTESIVSSGLTLVPEGRRVFSSLTVLENLRLGSTTQPKTNWLKRCEEMFTFFPILAERQTQLAGTLSGGQQQQLAIARALMSQPDLLLMDEPSLGLAPQIVDTIFELLIDLRKAGQTILLIEQNAAATLDVADYIYVMASGEIATEGTAVKIQSSGDIAKAYLGAEG